MTFSNLLYLKPVIEGLLTFLPSFSKLLTKKTSGTDSAEYCYSVWLRHEVKIRPYRNDDQFNTIVELGPGDSLGIGLSALLAGARNYIAIDAVKHADQERNLKIANELIKLFSNRTSIPDSDQFPEIKPRIESHHFPCWLADSSESSFNDRIYKVKHAVTHIDSPMSPIIYISPGDAHKRISENSVDFIFSQAVLEHVDDLGALYQDCYKWLTPGGLMSHQIDFRSHGTASTWDGHWTYSTFLWKMIKGRRPYLINRKPCSAHLKMIHNSGFEIVKFERYRLISTLKRQHLAKLFRGLSPDDLTTAGAYIIARKPVTEENQINLNHPSDKRRGAESCVE